jgi:hypothetical protein
MLAACALPPRAAAAAADCGHIFGCENATQFGLLSLGEPLSTMKEK